MQLIQQSEINGHDIESSNKGSKVNLICSNISLEITEIFKLVELSDEILSNKLNYIAQIENSDSFLSGNKANRADKNNIWFIIYYKSLLQASSKGNKDARAIIKIIQSFVKQDIHSESQIQINQEIFLELKPIKSDISHLDPGRFLYGFQLDYPGLENTICYNLQGFKEDASK